MNSDSLQIISAEYISEFRIRLVFNDGFERTVDFYPFLKDSNHATIMKYLDVKLFTAFDLADGNLNWNDYEMIFPVEDLYTGNLQK